MDDFEKLVEDIIGCEDDVTNVSVSVKHKDSYCQRLLEENIYLRSCLAETQSRLEETLEKNSSLKAELESRDETNKLQQTLLKSEIEQLQTTIENLLDDQQLKEATIYDQAQRLSKLSEETASKNRLLLCKLWRDWKAQKCTITQLEDSLTRTKSENKALTFEMTRLSVKVKGMEDALIQFQQANLFLANQVVRLPHLHAELHSLKAFREQQGKLLAEKNYYRSHVTILQEQLQIAKGKKYFHRPERVIPCHGYYSC